MIQRFLRNKVVEVEPHQDGTLIVSWRLTDDLLKADVQITIQLPEMEIIEAEAEMSRIPTMETKSASELIKNIEGISIGSGLRKIVSGLLMGPNGCPILAHGVLESANAVILHLTRPGLTLGEAIADADEKLAAIRGMIKSNPRLIRSCISFQDDSPIIQGIEL